MGRASRVEEPRQCGRGNIRVAVAGRGDVSGLIVVPTRMPSACVTAHL